MITETSATPAVIMQELPGNPTRWAIVPTLAALALLVSAVSGSR